MVVVNPSVQVDGHSASITYDLQQQEVRYSISLYISGAKAAQLNH
jgi:hypothetical protein